MLDGLSEAHPSEQFNLFKPMCWVRFASPILININLTRL